MLDDRFLHFCDGFNKDHENDLLVSLTYTTAHTLRLSALRRYKTPAERKVAGQFVNVQISYEAEGCEHSYNIVEHRIANMFVFEVLFTPTSTGSISLLGKHRVSWQHFDVGAGKMHRDRSGIRVLDLGGHAAELTRSPSGKLDVSEVRSVRQGQLRAALTRIDNELMDAYVTCHTLMTDAGIPESNISAFITDAESPTYSMRSIPPEYDRIKGLTDALRKLRMCHRMSLNLMNNA